jgi:hypothetical protein
MSMAIDSCIVSRFNAANIIKKEGRGSPSAIVFFQDFDDCSDFDDFQNDDFIDFIFIRILLINKDFSPTN